MEGSKSINLILIANIKRLRRKRHITQDDMSVALGMSKQSYYRIEAGKQGLRVELLPVIAEHLNTSIDALFGSGAINTQLEHSELLLMSYIRKLEKSVVKKIGTLVREVQTRGVDDHQLELVINLVRQLKGKATLP